MSYEVATPVYTGPFDLLLALIMRDEVDLWDLSIASVVDAFVAEVERLEHLDLEVATEFLLIAATLVELKARRLLPQPEDVTLDEELARFEERDLLLGRLLECKTFQDAAGALARRFEAARGRVPRRVGPEEPFRSLRPDPLHRLRPAQLARAAVRALGRVPDPTEVDTDHVAPIRASVRDAIDVVLVRLPRGRTVPFRELVAGVTERIEFVVRFLAVLELFKQGVVELDQATTFGELMVTRRAEAVPEVALDDWDDETGDREDRRGVAAVDGGPGERAPTPVPTAR